MTIKLYIYLLFSLLVAGCDQSHQINKKLFIVDDRKINVIKSKIQNKLPEYSAAYILLLKEADNLLLGVSCSSGFVLLRNPQNDNRLFSTKQNNELFQMPQKLANEQMKNIWILTMAWVYTNNETYANEASSLLRSTFVDSSSKLNPSDFLNRYVNDLAYDGVGMLYEMNSLILIADAVNVLAESNAWCAGETNKVKEWYKELVSLMVDEAMIRGWKNCRNSYLGSYLRQIMCFNYFVGTPMDYQEAIAIYFNATAGQNQMSQSNHMENCFSILSGDLLLYQTINKVMDGFEVGLSKQSDSVLLGLSCSGQDSLNKDQLEDLQVMLLITEGAFQLVKNVTAESVYRRVRSNHRVLLFPR